jgi:hypothetical protein
LAKEPLVTFCGGVTEAIGFYISQPSQLTGKFNKHLWTICFVFADEAFYAGDKPHESILKSLVTEETLTVEPKGVDAFQVPNHLDLLMASNSQWVVPVGKHGRRFAVFETSDRYGKGNCPDAERRAYFSALFAEINAGGIEAMMYDLLQRPLDNFDVEAFPVTKALIKQKQLTLRGFDKAFEAWLQSGTLPRNDKWSGRPDCATTDAMLEQIRKLRGCEYETDVALKDYFKEHFPMIDCSWRTPGWGNAGAKFPHLLDCREAFSARFGGDWPWDETITEWEEHPCPGH